MGTTRFVAVLLGLVVAASAQQVKPAPPAPQVQFARPAASTVIRPTQLARYELPPASAKGQRIPVDASDRLAPVLRHLLCGADDAAAQPTVRHASSSRGSWMFVVGTAEQVATANRVVAQLAQDLPLQARLQCSLVTLPLAIAREWRLEAAVVVAADETRIGDLARAAAKHGGALHNLPEVAASPLRPFALAVAAKAAVPETKRLRLRGEMVPASATEVAVRLHVVRGDLPVEPTCAPQEALLQPIVRLEAGKAAMVMAVEGDLATVLIVRCVELSNAPLPKADAR